MCSSDLVPGINDTEDKIREYIDLISEFSCVREYELLGFHTMGFFKYEELGIENRFKDKGPLPKERLDTLNAYVLENFKK